MNREQAREAVATVLSGLGTYALVAEGARRRFGGISPVALVLSRGQRWVQLTRSRSNDENVIKLSVTIYVRCEDGAEDTAEDVLDQLAEAAATALNTAGFIVGESDAAPDGAPLRNIDGVFYRVEVMSLTYEEWL